MAERHAGESASGRDRLKQVCTDDTVKEEPRDWADMLHHLPGEGDSTDGECSQGLDDDCIGGMV